MIKSRVRSIGHKDKDKDKDKGFFSKIFPKSGMKKTRVKGGVDF